MKVVCALLLFCSSELLARGQIPLNKLERFELYGHPYVRLEDWAKAYDFQVHVPSNGKDFCLTGASAKLRFTVDSPKAEINGINVWLSFPVAQRNGVVFVSPLDLRKMVNPVVSPPKMASGSKIKTVCLDPGHGGKDPGSQVGHHQEK